MTVPDQPYSISTREPVLLWMIIVSIGVHLAVFICVVVLPQLNANRKPVAPVYTVELVDLPDLADRPSPKPPVEQPPAVEEKAISLPEKAPRLPEAAVVKEPEPIPIVKKKRSQKIKVNEPPTEKRIEEQLKRLEKKDEKKEQVVAQKSLEEALQRLKSKESQTVKAETAENTAQVGITMKLWETRVWNKVRGNWSYPEILASKQSDLEAVVQVSVSREGRIRAYKLIKRSGNEMFDQSVVRAVRLSEPFPPFPKGYVKSFDVLELRFTLAELAGRS